MAKQKRTIVPTTSKHNNKKTNNIKTTPQPTNDNIFIDISQFKFKSIKVDDFTNFLKNDVEYNKLIDQLFHKDIPLLHQKKFDAILCNKSYHSHLLKDKELELTKKVLIQYGINLKDDEADNIFQINSGTGGIRLIGRRLGNILKLYFIDFHHLIDPHVKHNQKDYNMNSFCILNLNQKD